MLAPMLVQMERQIDREIAADQKKLGFNEGLQDHSSLDDDDSDMEDEEPVLMYGPVPQIVTNDLKSLDEMVSPELLTFIPDRWRRDVAATNLPTFVPNRFCIEIPPA